VRQLITRQRRDHRDAEQARYRFLPSPTKREVKAGVTTNIYRGVKRSPKWLIAVHHRPGAAVQQPPLAGVTV
jgi:hypothetical protein